MSRYVIYKDSTGEVVRSVSCAEALITYQVQAGEGYLESSGGEPQTHYVDLNGNVQELPLQPTTSHVWNRSTATWVDTRSLETLRQEQWEIIKAGRAVAETAAFSWNGFTFQADVIRIGGAVTEALTSQFKGLPWSKVWTLENNTALLLSSEEMIEVGQTLADQISLAHEKSRILRQQINNASTPAQIQAVKWY